MRNILNSPPPPRNSESVIVKQYLPFLLFSNLGPNHESSSECIEENERCEALLCRDRFMPHNCVYKERKEPDKSACVAEDFESYTIPMILTASDTIMPYEVIMTL